MEKKSYLRIVSYVESWLETYGDTHRGVGWPKEKDTSTRYQVMLEVIRTGSPTPTRLLDFGCGLSHLYEYMLREGVQDISYVGLDLSGKFLEISRRKFPANTYYHVDVLEKGAEIPKFDYIVMNGVFTVKVDLSFDEMFRYFKKLVARVYQMADCGIAFNVMSKQVDWERDDLFHLPLDTLAFFLTRELSRNFVIRNDYGLYEYTTYLYK